MEVLYGAPVEIPDRVEMVVPMLLRSGGGWALHYLTGPAQHCRSQNHHTGADSDERVRRGNQCHTVHDEVCLALVVLRSSFCSKMTPMMVMLIHMIYNDNILHT